MGYSKAHKTRTHKRIVSIASKRFREKGPAGYGIAELMKEADLMVGGFYKHFNSRDDLVAETVNSAFGRWKRRVDAAKSGGPSASLAKLIDDYAHRDNPGTGCAFSALARRRSRAVISAPVRFPNRSGTTFS
jgi:TetR/AcrR family transcriptional repressor of nem operon